MSSYSEGQTHQLMEALQKEGFASDDITKLGQSRDLPRILDVLRGRARIVDVDIEAAGVLKNEFLTLISPEPLIIGPAGGSEILANASDVFAFIDSDFLNWGADEPGTSMGETPVDVYEMAEDAAFAPMFGSLSSDVSRLCFTQSQIIGFVKQHRDWLRTDGYATFFLFKSHDQFFVAIVRFDSGVRLGVGVNRFEYSSVSHAEHRHRLAAPRLA